MFCMLYMFMWITNFSFSLLISDFGDYIIFDRKYYKNIITCLGNLKKKTIKTLKQQIYI